MSRALWRRLRGIEKRLQVGNGRAYVITMPDELADDDDAIERAKAEQGVDPGPRDLLVILKQFGGRSAS